MHKAFCYLTCCTVSWQGKYVHSWHVYSCAYHNLKYKELSDLYLSIRKPPSSTVKYRYWVFVLMSLLEFRYVTARFLYPFASKTSNSGRARTKHCEIDCIRSNLSD